ncbi:hypothetical protein SAMN05421837_107391 [Amycolatopsis pretoriensis]|uniref:Uncharacterized protein n=1 Tax=Amycolatopsis pretoriensis TaxID=218821 RepID=A0A1H5R7U4_9PSEU|nr:hypothetical protein [Amycolatopsis pretoriensis]SEF34443.1 hypothetical protein SAMN05421837_107391 [Amycolatopsis pretoriensis]
MSTILCHGEAAGYHHVEQSVRVDLHAAPDGQGWELCDLTAAAGDGPDAEPLVVIYEAPQQTNCACGTATHTSPECDAWAAQLMNAEIPGAHELLLMLAARLGYTVTKRDTE